MIKWVFEEVYPDLPQEMYDSCESLSSKIIPCAKMHQYNCMLEFHHSLQPRVDLSFYIISTTTSITSIELPSWWHAFLDICDHISSTSLSTSSDLSNMKKIDKYTNRYDDSLPYCLPDCHFLEFDLHSNSVELGGVFQRIDQLDDHIQFDVSCFFQILDRIPCVTKAEFRNELAVKLLAQLTEILGLPDLLGLMVGRGGLIKLIYHIRDKNAWKVKSDDYCQSLLQYFTPRFVENFKQTVNAFSCIPDISIRLCFDVSLVECFDAPRFCVEVFPVSNVKEARTYNLLRRLQGTFKLEHSHVRDIINLHRALPKGKRRIPCGPVIPGCEDERIYLMAATFSHYKIEFPIGFSPEIKTYVNIVSETI